MKRIFILCTLALGLFCADLYAQQTRKVDLLEKKYEETGRCFTGGAQWYQYPKYRDRAGWAKLLGSEYAAKLISIGEGFLGYDWKYIPASIYISLKETGDKSARNRYNNPNRAAFIGLCMAELAEGKGRFLKDIADGYWYYSTCSHWAITGETGGKVLPALSGEHLALGSVRVASMLSTFWPFFRDSFDAMDPVINETFKEAMHRIILDPYLDPEQHEWWEGGPTVHRRLNNHTPWCCHNILHAFLVVEEDPDAIDKAVRRAFASVDQFLGDIPSDGLCEEGPTYWFNSVGRLQEFLQLLKDASGGKFDVLPNELITKMGVYISRCCGGKDASSKQIVANYGDAHPFASFDPYILLKCGDMYDSAEMKDLALYSCWNGKKFKAPNPEKGEGYRALANACVAGKLFRDLGNLNSKVKNGENVEYILEDLRRYVPKYDWYPAGQQAFIHTSDGWFFSCKGAHNSESHNHNDVGSCILYVDGIAVLADSGTGTYTGKTFGPHRYEIWTMQAGWHNLPMPNGVEEVNGASRKARDVEFSAGKNEYRFSADISAAFPESSHCSKWIRTYSLQDRNKGSLLTIEDVYTLTERTAPDVEHFLMQGTVTLKSEGVVILENKGRKFEITYPADLLKASVDIQEDMDASLTKTWGKTLSRLSLTSAPDAPLEGSYIIKVRAL